MRIARILINLSTAGLVVVVGYLIFARLGHANALSNFSVLPQRNQDDEINPTTTISVKHESINIPPYEKKELPLKGIHRMALINTTIPNRPRVDVDTYEVQSGDNLFSIAERYGLKPETVLWGNYDTLRDNPQFLQPGQILIILPTDGVYYQWANGDTLTAVADFFEVDTENIYEWPGNDFDPLDANTENPSISKGTWLIIPGGRRALKDWGPPAITRANPAAAKYYGSGYCGQVYEGAVGTGAFIWPTVATYLSGYDYNPSIHPGIDIAGAEGNAVFASDSGVVVYAGWSEYGYGYLIVLDHGNGWQTAYAHLSAVGVNCGQSVARGKLIGAVGNTGNSSGAHLHFEMRSDSYGKANPWNFVTS